MNVNKDSGRLMGGRFHSNLGDGLHVVTLFSTATFAYYVVRNFSNDQDWLLDPEWKRFGFCIANPDVPFWTTHDLCLYVDLVATAVLSSLYMGNRKRPGMERANEIMLTGLVGQLVHGISHGGLGYFLRNGVVSEDNITLVEYEVVRGLGMHYLLPQIVFWFLILWASLPNVEASFILPLSLVVRSAGAYLPGTLAFTYVQTVLMLAFSGNQLARPRNEKDFHYTMHPIFLGIPLSLVGWLESSQCSSFVKDRFYGHLVYDAMIPFGTLLWYLLCIGRVKSIAEATSS